MSKEETTPPENIVQEEEKIEIKNEELEFYHPKNLSHSQIIESSLDLEKPKEKISEIDIKSRKSTINHDYSVKTLNIIRVFAFITILAFLIITFLSIIIYERQEKHTNHILLCFVFEEDVYYPFRTSIYAFYLFILLLFFQTLVAVYYIFRYDLDEIKNYIIKPVWLINATLLTISVEFLVGDYMSKNLSFNIIHLIFSGTGLLLSGWIYLSTRNNSYNNMILLLSEYALSSSLFSFECYLVLFNLCGYFTKTPNDPSTHKENFNIIFNIIYFSFGLISLTIFKDIIFPVVLIIMELGLLMEPTCKFREILTSILITLFVFYALVYTVFRNKKEIFRYKKEEKFKLIPLVDDKLYNK